MKLDTIHCGDCLEWLKTLPPGCVDAVVTDPPYGVNVAKWDTAVPPQAILDECLRVSGGPVMWFGAAKQIWDFAHYEPKPDRMIVWHVTFSMAKTNANGMFYRWHPIWCWRLPKKQGGLSSDVIQQASEAKRQGFYHPGMKPLRLMVRLAAVVDEGATVLDPFMGSGTTAVACIRTGRHFLGCEISPEYCAIAEKRIRDARGEMALFDAPKLGKQEAFT